jgi:bifunctional DNA-binding transcriptional regulator/antitoxin component of YhaV-PrlF toxin-antitoxin module
MESGPRGVDHITIPHEKMRESGWQVGDEVTFNWDGKRMILTKLPKQVAVSKVPAEVEISAETNAQESPEKTINIMSAPATNVPEREPSESRDEYQRRCPVCKSWVHGIESKCRSCGASLESGKIPGFEAAVRAGLL